MSQLDREGMHPDTPDVPALQRRVLLAGLATILLFFASAGLVSTIGVSTAWLLLAVVVIYVAVTRPLMQPVFAAIKLRRRLAYQAFLEHRERGDMDGLEQKEHGDG